MKSAIPAKRLSAKVLNFQFSFLELLDAEETMLDLDDTAEEDGPFLDFCFSMTCRLADLVESADEAKEGGESYPLSWAKEQWLDLIVVYSSIAERRLAKGEALIDSEGATEKFREELQIFRQLLAAHYTPERFAALAAIESVGDSSLR